jgi:hypothetical protein
MTNGLERQKAKGDLVEKVLEWALAKPTQAREAFQTCAKDVFTLFTEIERNLETTP